MDRTDARNADEAWILKYRNAIKDIPIQPPGHTKIRVALNRAHGFVSASLRRILDRWARSSPPRSASVLQLPSSIGRQPEQSRADIPAEKAMATTGRLKPGRSTDQHRAQRGA
jgi:hypothetical protein